MDFNVQRESGVSVIICCFNSVKRLRPTLEALCKQQVSSQLKWEINIIDNASDDDTRIVANEIWNSFVVKPQIPFKIFYEPIPGLGNARKKGIENASYKYVLFCDDDNWLAEKYIQGIYETLAGDPALAACGGKGVPVFETEKPDWFDYYEEAFAVGSQAITEENNVLFNLYGAGLAVNIAAIREIEKSGFKPQMTGRTGKKLSSSEDTELTYAFVLMGYKLKYCDNLQFFHYLPKERLQFSYLKKLFIAFGTDGAIRNLYYAHISKRFFHRMTKNWYVHLLLSAFRLIKYLIIPPKKYGRVIYFNWNIAYLKELFLIKRKYSYIIGNIQSVKSHRVQQTLPGIESYSLTSV